MGVGEIMLKPNVVHVFPSADHVFFPTPPTIATWTGLLLLPVPWNIVSADADQMFLGLLQQASDW